MNSVYEYREKSVDNENFTNNIRNKKYKNYLLEAQYVQNSCFLKDTVQVVPKKVAQRMVEEHLVAADKDIPAVKRGNVRGDIIKTRGMSYFLVQEIRLIFPMSIE